ncbi:hypothetical protein CNMCM6106_007561 [Aspergillus hiratsukae]|uniref:FAD/NAD(P)-binding domain-containing protein n=1 Tax=Aspergillus hiratsukae TaxID=1194566 RepID=A0A8H6QI81_9EURO|nr:hypothetical protein CNMCM6106_007561 [Aspergillus hiratsukae]
MSIGKLLSNGALLFDVLIIGAGPAGLSTATGLARQLHTAVVFDSGVYRNAMTQHMHNVLGWDHRNPAELRAAGRADLTNRYSTIQFQNSTIEAIRHIEAQQLFEARDDQGHRWYGRKLVLATGVRDIPLDIEGYAECWANGIYHCLFCDGYEERGQETAGVLALGPIANPPRALHLARMARRLSQSVTVYTNGNEQLAKEIQQAAEVSPVGTSWLKFDARPITRFEKGEVAKTVIVHFAAGESKTEGFLVYNPQTEVNGPFAKQLALAMTEGGDIQTTPPFHETSVPGVFAVGDCATPLKAVTPAVAMGSLAAGGLVAQLQAQRLPEFCLDRELIISPVTTATNSPSCEPKLTAKNLWTGILRVADTPQECAPYVSKCEVLSRNGHALERKLTMANGAVHKGNGEIIYQDVCIADSLLVLSPSIHPQQR